MMGTNRKHVQRKVRFFSASFTGGLEEAINAWLADRGDDFWLLDIKFNMTEVEGRVLCTAMVIYEDMEPEDDEEEAEE